MGNIIENIKKGQNINVLTLFGVTKTVILHPESDTKKKHGIQCWEAIIN